MFNSKTVAIITGASKGFGRAIASSLTCEFSKTDEGRKSVLVLVSRSTEGMEETKKIVEQISTEITVHIVSGDLGDLPNLPELTTKILTTVKASEFSSAVLINNAGSIGEIEKKIGDFLDVEDIHQYMGLNVTSPFFLISHFLRVFSSIKKYVINISTLCAVVAQPTFSQYCSSKAARDMLHQVLAVESDDVRVLNYAPGPLKTEMFYTIVNTSASDEMRTMFQGLVDSGSVLEPETSSDKLVVLLKQDRYKSGAHVDYFDELP